MSPPSTKTINNNNNTINQSAVTSTLPPPPPPPLPEVSRIWYPITINKASTDPTTTTFTGDLSLLNSYQRHCISQESESTETTNNNNQTTSTKTTMVGQQQPTVLFKNDLNAKPPVNPKIAHHIDTMQMYNLMQDIAIPKMIMDLRPREMYERSHLKAAISIPPPSLEQVDDEHLPEFNMTKYLAVHCPTTRYWNLMLSQAVIYTDGSVSSEMGREHTLSRESIAMHDNSDVHPLESRDPTSWFNFVLHYLIARSKKTAISIYDNGFEAFNQHYPFLCRGVTVSNKAYRNIPESSLYPSEILKDFIYLGAYENATSRSQLDNLKITHIVNMASELEDAFPHLYKYYRADLDDNFRADITSHFEPINQFIDSAKATGGRVLVHCAMGISRSTTAVMAYIMKTQGLDYATTRQLVKEKRSIIQPNVGFVKALKAYDEKLHESKPIDSKGSSLSSSQTQLQQRSSSSGSIMITNNDGCTSILSSSPPSTTIPLPHHQPINSSL
ncbi:putative protein tyrosine phosphatase [Cavenderia fasciculata]|uniref:Protein-serine/threonine phosphatase n=1 Tax=Cavenderia fasciculata TaxID=261658 RepID=F4PTZ8_CACFS|nr:putative protein tyrosine phosphatase [Cavenderia fasciculata]EGG21766.1 putative protein tyrosine phosphatase [Cavenderia fasciculata]|eukprot:XP_004359616.1 putative protein tyrosine phosphatase [Cavenderia fasciculata]